MASLYVRATPPQARVLRIIEGAIKNAADAHEEIKVSPRHRRSIAKRAAGTLSAQWPDVLAATRRSGDRRPKVAPSEKLGERVLRSPEARALAVFTTACAAGNRLSMPSEAGGPDRATTLPLLGIAETALKACAGPLRKMGDGELYEAVIVVLQIIGKRRKAAGIPVKDTSGQLAH